MGPPNINSRNKMKSQKQQIQKEKIIKHQRQILKQYNQDIKVDINYLMQCIECPPTPRANHILDNNDIIIQHQQQQIYCYKKYLENQQNLQPTGPNFNYNTNNGLIQQDNIHSMNTQSIKRVKFRDRSQMNSFSPTLNTNNSHNNTKISSKKQKIIIPDSQSTRNTNTEQYTMEQAALDKQYEYHNGHPPNRLVVPRGYYERTQCYGCGSSCDPDDSLRLMGTPSGRNNNKYARAENKRKIWDDIGRSRDEWRRRHPKCDPYLRHNPELDYSESESEEEKPYYRRRNDTLRGYDDGRISSISGIERNAPPYNRCALDCDGKSNCNLCAANHYIYM